jgi:FlaA1/EpsC-like NDP-sugar epimerase
MHVPLWPDSLRGGRWDRTLSAFLSPRTRTRRIIRIVVDCLIWVVALYVAALLRLDFDFARLSAFDVTWLIPAAWMAQAVIGYTCGLYRGRWIIGSFDEAPALGACVGLTTVALIGYDLVEPDVRPAPVSSVIAAGLVAFVTMGVARHLMRRAIDHQRRSRADGRTPAIVFGAGEGGELAVRSMLYDGSPFHPVAVLDDDLTKRNLSISGVRVLGDRTAIAAVAERTGASALIAAVPTGDGALIRSLSELGLSAGLDVRVVPSLGELLEGRVTVRDMRAPTEVDLLGRHAIETDLDAVSEYLSGQRVLVTGAGGSIGSELCRQIARFDPEQLVMVDRDESNLHAVQLSIEGRALLDSANLLLVDIRDRTRLRQVMKQARPDVVFHAAALKHLPLLQAHPVEALKTNVWGTVSVLQAAAEAGASCFVNISTDKAADACSALGYSKRIAEALTAYFARQEPGRYLSVRFGNVLGSRGSVLTAFRSQLDAGQPLTVTDPDVTRFFMTVEEAVQLVVQAGAIGHDGEVLVLDMGEPVRIADVARQLAASRTPEVPIVFTGLRPGEKLHEELFCRAEMATATEHPLIRQVGAPPLDPSFVENIEANGSGERMLDILRLLAAQIDGALENSIDLTTDHPDAAINQIVL